MVAYNWHNRPTFWKRNGRRLIALAIVSAVGILLLAWSYPLQIA